MKREPEDIKKEIALFYQVAQTVHSLEINELLREIVQIAIEVTHGDSCLIYVLDPKKDELVLRASKASHPKLMQKLRRFARGFSKIILGRGLKISDIGNSFGVTSPSSGAG